MAVPKSSEVLNAIRSEASAEYQQRVPKATAENLAEVKLAILDYNPSRNEFVSMLLNRIGKVVISDKMYNNPLKEFKKGMLDYGKTIEEVFVDLIKEKAFDVSLAETTLYKRNPPDVKAVFHEINRQGYYETTVENHMLAMAFTSEEGMNNLVEKIISKLYTSDEYDEFIYMKNIIKRYGDMGGFKVIPIADPTDEATAKLAMVNIKQVSNDITFMKTDYNYAGVYTHTPKEDQIVLINTKFDALIDVEVLASAFNMSKADFIGRRVLIDDFGGLQDVVCAIVDRKWFMVYDNLLRSEDIYNPKGLYYNYFLHHWQVLSASPFHNAILFVTGASTVTAITQGTIAVKKGQSVQIMPNVTGTGNFSRACDYKFTSDVTSSMTTVNSLGFVVVGEDEDVGPKRITITSKQTPSVELTFTLSVTE